MRLDGRPSDAADASDVEAMATAISHRGLERRRVELSGPLALAVSDARVSETRSRGPAAPDVLVRVDGFAFGSGGGISARRSEKSNSVSDRRATWTRGAVMVRLFTRA